MAAQRTISDQILITERSAATPIRRLARHKRIVLRAPRIGFLCVRPAFRYRDGGRVFYRPSIVERSQRLGHTPPMIVGLLSIAVATSLGAWGTARLAVANPTARLPFWGSPPHKPSGTRFLNLVMISSLIFGTAQLFDGGNHPSQLWEIPVFLTFLAASLVLPSA